MGRTLVARVVCCLVLLAIGAGGFGEPVSAVSRCQGRIVTKSGSGTINGTSGDDVILGSASRDTINGNGGNDFICALGGNDVITTGSGADSIEAGDGDPSPGPVAIRLRGRVCGGEQRLRHRRARRWRGDRLPAQVIFGDLSIPPAHPVISRAGGGVHDAVHVSVAGQPPPDLAERQVLRLQAADDPELPAVDVRVPAIRAAADGRWQQAFRDVVADRAGGDPRRFRQLADAVLALSPGLHGCIMTVRRRGVNRGAEARRRGGAEASSRGAKAERM
jgi:hypothetical protein